jgi:hypothetical protein
VQGRVDDKPRNGRSVAAAGCAFLAAHPWRVLAISVLLVVPCLWHQRIEAGDLGSHVYNAWLAQLISKGQAPGLYIAHQWNNVLFDVTLLHVGNVVGFAAAQKIVVPACVLLFFWGVFALVAALSARPPWILTPAIGMLAYGYSFNSGFFNYYLSIGLACLFLALVWRLRLNGPVDWLTAIVLALLTMLAHPLGICWIAGVLIYRWMRPWLLGWWKLVIPVTEFAVYRVALWYVHHKKLDVDWHSSVPFYAGHGADQLSVYGDRYLFLVWATLLFAIAVFVVDLVKRWRDSAFRNCIVFPVELYALLICTIGVVPENLRVGLYAAWIGLLASRLTCVTAIAGLAVLACAKPRWWHVVGFGGIAAVFFLFLYQDTGKLNRLEANAESLIATLPLGTRVVPTIAPDPNWRVEFIAHVVDRACVGHCFVYSNYEPPSRQFRIRVAAQGSWIATPSADDADDMQGGSYEIESGDLPLKHIYQCVQGDWTKLCMRDLVEGQSTSSDWVRPAG